MEDIEKELLLMCHKFLKCISIMYIKGELTRDEFREMKRKKILFIKDCGVW